VVNYPQRPAFFACKFVRLMTKQVVAQRYGTNVFALLTIIVTQEDAVHYRPVTYFNERLMELMGIRKWETLAAARQQAVDAGWLHYEPPPFGTRQPGTYFVLVPPEFRATPDSAVDEGDPIEAAYLRGYADAKAKRPSQPYPENGDGEAEAYPQNGEGRGYGAGYGRGDGRGYGMGEPSTLSLSLSLEESRRQIADVQKGRQRKAKAPPEFTPEDLSTAESIWRDILARQPDRTPPKLPKWADEIRLMRTRDGRDHAAVLNLWRRVQADSFWRDNILSPAKLREKWDDLQLKLAPKNGNGQANLARVHTGRYDNAPDRY
jgi:hypothetical protein